MLRSLIVIAASLCLGLGVGISANAAERSVALIMDASGSMRGQLPDGVAKIDAAKSAVKTLTGEIPDDVRLSFRAYGHQSHRREKNCKDTQYLVPFDRAVENRGDVVLQSADLKAQGYTPISLVLGLAADDVKPEPGEHVIVLVSDGKETCKGDPCVLARKLAEADAGLSIHTIGFGADYQAQQQLQCIAKAARGQYFDANSADELAKTLNVATTAELTKATIVIQKTGPGILRVENGQFHNVYDAETGKKVDVIETDKVQVAVPAGIYNVEFGDGLLWKSIEVAAEETTTVHAGVLEIENNQVHQILDTETGQKLTDYANATQFLALPPGKYDVSFQDAVWRGVEIAEGEKTVLSTGVLSIANNQFHQIRDTETGDKLGNYASSDKWIPLPPGKYDVMFDDVPWRVELAAGEQLALNPGGISVQPKGFHSIYLPDGTKAATLASSDDRQMLPPGDYLINIHNQKVPVTVVEGQIIEIKAE